MKNLLIGAWQNPNAVLAWSNSQMLNSGRVNSVSHFHPVKNYELGEYSASPVSYTHLTLPTNREV